MNNGNGNHSARIGAFTLSIAVALAAAIGLTAANERAKDRPAVSSGSVSQRGDIAPLPAISHDDPELMRLDRANEHHG